jgi:hypothetical protein
MQQCEGYGLDRSSIPDFSLLHSVQTGSGTHRASYPVGIKESLTGVKRPELEIDHSPPSSAEAKNGEVISPLPPHVFMVGIILPFLTLCNNAKSSTKNRK